MSSPDLSLILACYNEAQHLEQSLRQLELMLRQLRCTHELIFIDDASQDTTVEILRRIGQAHPEYRVLTHERNAGRGATVAEGLRLARGSIAGYLDMDMEVSPCYLAPMLAMFEEGGYDVVVGRRVYKIQASLFSLLRHVAHLGYQRLARRLLPIQASDSEAGFKFFDREKILPVLETVTDQRWFWDTEVLVRAERAGLCIREITCLYERNLAKTSTVRLIPDTIEYLRQLRRLRRELLESGSPPKRDEE